MPPFYYYYRDHQITVPRLTPGKLPLCVWKLLMLCIIDICHPYTDKGMRRAYLFCLGIIAYSLKDVRSKMVVTRDAMWYSFVCPCGCLIGFWCTHISWDCTRHERLCTYLTFVFELVLRKTLIFNKLVRDY